ncbi:MAG: hypothetical protein MUE79_09130 [Nitratireductor sp.]|nr:hypothetical protein [Nitratireductor sp.]
MQTTKPNANFQPAPQTRSLASRLRRSGHVFVEGQTTGFPCAIASMTEEGAVITAQGWLGVPDMFDLLVKPDGNRHACRVKARRGNTLTVSFESR